MMIHPRVLTSEEVMEVDPPVTDLAREDNSTDSEYTDVDDGGVMLVEDSEDERENMPLPPPMVWAATPHPAPVLRELILIKEPAPLNPGVNIEEGEDDVWYIPPVMCHQIHAINKFSIHQVDLLPEYVEDLREDLLAGPPRDNLAADGLEDEMWVNLRVAHRLTE